MWDYSGYANYNGAADVGDPPVRQRVHVLGLLGLEQGAGHQQRRLRRRRAEPDRRSRPGASTTRCVNYDRHAQHRAQRHLPDAERDEQQGARPARERLADLGRLPMDERPALHGRLLDPGHRRREPHRHRRQPERADRRDLRPGQRLQRRSVPAARTPRASRRRSRAARATSRRASSCAIRRSTTSTCRSSKKFARRARR